MVTHFLPPNLNLFRVEPAEKVLDVFLPNPLFEKFEVIKQPTWNLPTEWKDPYTGDIYSIVWVNAFELVPRAEFSSQEQAPVDYEVQFERPIMRDLQDIRAFYFADGKIEPFDPLDSVDLRNGRWAVRLRVPDPGVGLGGKQAI